MEDGEDLVAPDRGCTEEDVVLTQQIRPRCSSMVLCTDFGVWLLTPTNLFKVPFRRRNRRRW